MNTGRYSLKQLLNSSEIEQIIIPELQRDYVWGKENVEGLLNSIFSNFNKKIATELEIKNGDEEITPEVKLFLSKEYSRLRYNTQIGFIYAYHDVDYAGKFFLIDGQQRLTTLYLLLLALYRLTGKCDEFEKLYFKNNVLKLDYKVRETSHDFMMDFAKHQLNAEVDCDFDKSDKYYKELYSKDKTAKTLLNNFSIIMKYLEQKSPNDEYIDYVENFIEFNYFDTNLSEQGEHLYLYMNSRGENLSQQEIVKASLIKRSKNKLNAGEKWEKWQNFFWKYRGENINADKGFEEFLKWATIIHICTTENPQLKPALTDSKQTTQEIKEDYVRLEKNSDRSSQQERWLKEYQLNNNGFDIEFLSGLFEALRKLEDYNLINAPFFRDKWLSNIKFTIDYVSICSALYYLHQNKTAEPKDIERTCMYLKNICYYIENSKNPDRIVIVALETLKKLSESDSYDIINVNKLEKVPPYFYSDSDKQIIKLYNTPEREKWEEIFWSVTNNNEICSFIAGNFIPLLNLCGNEEKYSPEMFEKYLNLFESKIVKRKSDNNLRKDLLKYGDISNLDGGGSGNLGFYMERLNLIDSDDDWRQILTDKIEIIKNYIDEVIPTDVPDWRQFFIEDKWAVWEYIGQRKILWYEDDSLPRIILLSGHQASEGGSREIQIQLLHKIYEQTWVSKYDTCTLGFNILNGEIIVEQKEDKNFFLEIQYKWKKDGGEWFLYLGHRSKKIGTDDFKCMKNRDRALNDDKIPIYVWDVTKSMEDNIDAVKGEVGKFLLELL